MSRLNREQYDASLPAPGVHLVLAGAGTGKTSTLVERAKNSLREMIGPGEKLLVLTFSRKAAGEVRERIEAAIPGSSRFITAGTFHSFCLDLLKQEAAAYLAGRGWRSFPAILDESASEKIRAGIVVSFRDDLKGIPDRVALRLIARDRKLDSILHEKLARAGLVDIIEAIKEAYARFKSDRGYIDYSDMIDDAINLLEGNPAILNRFRCLYPVILVDEFQDSSRENICLLKLLSSQGEPNIFAVGDDWQSIYGFRGADPSYMIRMEKHFGRVRLHRLRVNYRSHREIVCASASFIKLNKKRIKKKIISAKGKGGSVRAIHVATMDEEFARIRELVAAPCVGTTVILYRTNRQGERYGELARQLNIEAMTMHRAKGLEFDRVIVAGIKAGIVPDPSTDIEEERRLFYVAMTRAQRELYLVFHGSDAEKMSVFARETGNLPRERGMKAFFRSL